VGFTIFFTQETGVRDYLIPGLGGTPPKKFQIPGSLRKILFYAESSDLCLGTLFEKFYWAQNFWRGEKVRAKKRKRERGKLEWGKKASTRGVEQKE